MTTPGSSKEEVSDDRLRNTRAWAAARLGQLSGAEVIVAACDEALAARTANETGAPASNPLLFQLRRVAKSNGYYDHIAPFDVEIERLQRELASFQKANAELALSHTLEPCPVPDHEFERLVADFGTAISLWTTGGGSRDEAKAKAEAVLMMYYARAAQPPATTPTHPDPTGTTREPPIGNGSSAG